MFRSIGNSISRRSSQIIQASQKKQNLDKITNDFLETIFGPAAKQIKVEVTLEKSTLFLKTSNKIVANEIVFQSGEFHKHLKLNGVRYDKIIIQ